MSIYTKQKTCRFCGSKNVHDVLNLGRIYPSYFYNKNTKKKFCKAPLVVMECFNCGLVQLRYTVDLDLMYREYWYKSGLNPSMVKSLKDVVEGIEKRIELKNGDIVVDIGCNDGTLLAQYSNKNLFKVGYDPALNVKDDAKKNCDYFVNDYFNSKDSIFWPKEATVITSIAMFYDLPDPNKFIEDIIKILAIEGIWVIQFTDLASMLRINAFDNICFEHLEYYSLEVLDSILRHHGLEIFDIERNNVNGGSIRVYVGFAGIHKITDEFYKAYREDMDYIYSFSRPMEAFAERVENIKEKIHKVIYNLHSNKVKVYALGASTKGNTLLQYFNLKGLIKFATDVNKDKWGLKTLGTDILILEDGRVWPDYFLVLPWHFIEFFLVKYRSFLKKGGRLIVPMPEPGIYSMGSEEEIKWTPLT